MSEERYNPFWHSGAAAMLLCGIIVSMYLYLLQPAMEKSVEMKAKVEAVESRIADKKKKLGNIRQKSQEIERGDPETIKETIRQELLKGGKNEFIL